VKGAKSEYETINASTLEFQMMAKRLKSTVLLLSQVSNDGAKYQDDVVMSFKGSGSIAAAADFAIELQSGEEDRKVWKQKVHAGEPVLMKWQIRKNRHGKTGYVGMMFDGRTGIFELSELEQF
jgi:replicative DNA helicase